jgi:soluble lytic murein transglycosylase-like protein
MRAQADPNAVRVALLTPGTRFTVVRGTTGSAYKDAAGSNRSDWLDIEYDSKRGFVAAAFVDLLEPTTVADDPNAILFTYEPTGASDKTARQDNLPSRGIVGVKASEAMAETDRARVVPHKAKFVEAGQLFDLPPALLAAIASRESRCGNVLDNDGFGDGGNAFGIMQVDKRFHSPIEPEGGHAGKAHIQQATEILRDKLDGVNRHVEGLSDSQSLQAAVSRYNGGSRLLPPRSDEGTTGGDYMNDVWARARYYAKVVTW